MATPTRAFGFGVTVGTSSIGTTIGVRFDEKKTRLGRLTNSPACESSFRGGGVPHFLAAE